jgi:hypothetical protein
MSTLNIASGEIVTEAIILDEFGESLDVEGQLITEMEPAVTTQNILNQIEVESDGAIQANSTAIQVDGVATIIDNEGLIDGGFNGINLANGDIASAQITNEGIITSGSRAVNIGGVGGILINEDEGLITGSADPRNGTVYGDVTAQNIFIKNLDDAVIDVGEGLNGDAISLELGAEVKGSVINEGLVQGRGLPGVANPDNQASAVRLYWVPTSGSEISIFNGNIENSGTLAAENGPAVIIEENVEFNGSIINTGLIESSNPINGEGILFENGSQLLGEIVNDGTINGGLNGVNFANGGQVNGVLRNLEDGVITSSSRAVNIGGDTVTLVNEGLITGSADPRNGTVYGDVTAQNIFIKNLDDAVIDVGEGLNGDAISLELGAEVKGSVINEGLVQGRGLPGVANPDNQASAVRLYWVPTSGSEISIFNGNIENSGTLAAENGPTVIIEENVEFNGSIINNGLIEGGDTENGQLAIDLSGVVNGVEVINSGDIEGDVILSENSDLFDSTGGEVNGTVFGGGGDDTLIGGNEDDILHGGQGDDLLNGGLGDNTLVGGAGADQFVLAVGGTNMINDFEIGIDTFVLEGFSFEQLELTQRSNNIRIELLETNEVLAVVQNITVEELNGSFV